MNRRTIINGIALLAIVIVVGAGAWMKSGRQEMVTGSTDAQEMDQGVPYSPGETADTSTAATPLSSDRIVFASRPLKLTLDVLGSRLPM